MKPLFFIWLIAFSVAATAAGPVREEFICSIRNLKRVKALATNHSTYDKNRHCSVSCMLTLKCDPIEVTSVGILKEIADALGFGNAELADLEADALGVELAMDGVVLTDNECMSHCDLYYP